MRIRINRYVLHLCEDGEKIWKRKGGQAIGVKGMCEGQEEILTRADGAKFSDNEAHGRKVGTTPNINLQCFSTEASIILHTIVFFVVVTKYSWTLSSSKDVLMHHNTMQTAASTERKIKSEKSKFGWTRVQNWINGTTELFVRSIVPCMSLYWAQQQKTSLYIIACRSEALLGLGTFNGLITGRMKGEFMTKNSGSDFPFHHLLVL